MHLVWKLMDRAFEQGALRCCPTSIAGATASQKWRNIVWTSSILILRYLLWLLWYLFHSAHFCTLLHSPARSSTLLHAPACFCRFLQVPAGFCTVLHVPAFFPMQQSKRQLDVDLQLQSFSLFCSTQYCKLLHDPARFCTLLHISAGNCRFLQFPAVSCSFLQEPESVEFVFFIGT